MLAKHMNNFKLALLDNDIQSVRVESLRPVLHAVVDQQSVRQPCAELEGDLPT